MSLVYCNQTCDIIRKELAKMPGTVASKELEHAAHNWHPLLVGLDAMLRMAASHKSRFESPISEDYFLGPRWLGAAKGLRELLNGDFGPIDNGTAESIFWAAMDSAGFSESDL